MPPPPELQRLLQWLLQRPLQWLLQRLLQWLLQRLSSRCSRPSRHSCRNRCWLWQPLPPVREFSIRHCCYPGKTFTMIGEPDAPGVMPLAVADLFKLAEEEDESVWRFGLTYVEIYNERVKDLLNPEAKSDLEVAAAIR